MSEMEQAGAAPAATTGTTTTGGGLSFQVTFNSVVYTISVYAPDPHSQYGFTITYENTTATPPTTVTVASLIYANDLNWEVIASLPKSLQVDSNLTVNSLSLDLTKGTVSPLPVPGSLPVSGGRDG
jgi:hypothetical protein